MGFVIVIVIAMVLILSCVLAFAPWPEGSSDRPDAEETSSVLHAGQPESPEGVLVAQRVNGEISRHQYLQAMEKLAARDDERHPLSVPPDIGNADV